MFVVVADSKLWIAKKQSYKKRTPLSETVGSERGVRHTHCMCIAQLYGNVSKTGKHMALNKMACIAAFSFCKWLAKHNLSLLLRNCY